MLIIYKFTNKLNGKVYIGQTIQTLEERVKQHIHRKDGTYFHNTLSKYGIESFDVDVIDTATTTQELNNKERYWIEHYNSCDKRYGYNTTLGGETNPMQCISAKNKHDAKMASEETRKKISDSMRALRASHPFSQETRDKISKALRGNAHFAGHKRSEDAILATSRALMKPVYCINTGTEEVFEFQSVKEACEWLALYTDSKSSSKTMYKHIHRSIVKGVIVDGLQWYYK